MALVLQIVGWIFMAPIFVAFVVVFATMAWAFGSYVRLGIRNRDEDLLSGLFGLFLTVLFFVGFCLVFGVPW